MQAVQPTVGAGSVSASRKCRARKSRRRSIVFSMREMVAGERFISSHRQSIPYGEGTVAVRGW